MTKAPVEVLWCPNSRTGSRDKWSFPLKVERHLMALTEGCSVLHLFGGKSRWGVRLDIDPMTCPDVIGDAWLPPFGRDAFDVVILDPPYRTLNHQMHQALMRSAAYVARQRVIWFHTLWIPGNAQVRLERAWLVRVGDNCLVRVVQVFGTSAASKVAPRLQWSRGPALKYTRWLAGAQRLPLEVPA